MLHRLYNSWLLYCVQALGVGVLRHQYCGPQRDVRQSVHIGRSRSYSTHTNCVVRNSSKTAATATWWTRMNYPACQLVARINNFLSINLKWNTTLSCPNTGVGIILGVPSSNVSSTLLQLRHGYPDIFTENNKFVHPIFHFLTAANGTRHKAPERRHTVMAVSNC